jgi:hypothetical protein
MFRPGLILAGSHQKSKEAAELDFEPGYPPKAIEL